MKVFLVGAGLWSAVMAERIATVCQLPVTIFERRPYAGGNCHSYFDATSGIEVHTHGTHIFHTQKEHVWKYITQFSAFTPYRHRVFSVHDGQVYSMPINLGTINQFYKKNLTPAEAAIFLHNEIAQSFIAHPQNLEEKAISLIGRPLYEAFIKGYTQKQWECDPRTLPAYIINRLPVRLSYNTEYFNDYWQGMPKDGYGALFANILKNKNITVVYNTPFESIQHSLPKDALIFYTGHPDALFQYKYGTLEWRSLRFEQECVAMQDFQGTSVMNYADIDCTYTRIHEFKHLHPERTQAFMYEHSIICKEFSQNWQPGLEAYYPIHTEKNSEIYAQYAKEAEKNPQLFLGGRLGKYKYFDMDTCIDDALQMFEQMKERCMM